MKKKFIYKDKNKELFRDSCYLRIFNGTITITLFGGLFAYSVYQYRNLHRRYIFNWIKGSFLYSSAFFTLNEALLIFSKYHYVYTNYFINYTLCGYILSKHHIKYLIKYNNIPWHQAIMYSHKCFLTLVIFSVIYDMIIDFLREAYLFEGLDILQTLEDLAKNNEDMSFEQLRKLQNSLYFRFHDENTAKDIMKYGFYRKSILHIDLLDYYKQKRIENNSK